jgi:ditrans,polycis-polyprenyl diphosphate synthase
MTLECISGSDGKEGIAKAANLLCSTYLNGDRSGHENVKSESVFTETDMASALKSVGTLKQPPFSCMIYLIIMLVISEFTLLHF